MKMHIGLIIVMMSIGANACAGSSVMTAFNVESSLVLHRQDNNFGQAYILNDSSVFVAKQGDVGAIVSASLFFNGAIDRKALVNRMLWMLEATNAPSEFRNWAKKTLPENWLLEKASFVLPLRSEKYGMHEFTYSNTGHNQLYILTYRRPTTR